MGRNTYRRSLRCQIKVSSGPEIQPEGPRSQHAQWGKPPSPRLRIGESWRLPLPHCQVQEAPRFARRLLRFGAAE
eukprot:11844383-Alexandrium_andersonii.AAC.1